MGGSLPSASTLQSNQSNNMKFTLAIASAVMAFSAVQAAPATGNVVAPNNGGEYKKESYGEEKKHDDKKYDDKKDEDKKDMGAFPFEFTSIYEVYASPDTIIS